MATLSSMVEGWISALKTLTLEASSALQRDTDSTTTFHNNCEHLVGNTLTFQGLGAKAFDTLFALNEAHSQMAQAKIHDFYNANNNLAQQIEEITSHYDNLNDPDYFTSLDRYAGENTLQKFLPALTSGDIYLEILQRLRDSFLEHSQLDDVLDPVNMVATIYLATNWERGNLMSQIDATYQQMVGNMQRDITAHPDSSSLDQYALQNINREHEEARWVIETLVNNTNAQLNSWALDLRAQTMNYYSEVLAASKVDQPTVADIVYESNLPQYSNSPVLFYQLDDGSLLIAIKGGTEWQDEQLIRDYIANHQKAGAKITIMGIGNDGMNIAQQLIDKSVNPQDMLPFQVVNAVMVGQNLPTSFTQGVNYVNYWLAPNEPTEGQTSLHLTKEQITLMTLTAIGSVALASPELLAGEFTAVYGDLAQEKLMEYAVTLGYNAQHPEKGLTPQQYLQQYLRDQYLSDNQSFVNNRPLKQYVQDQLSLGNTTPTDLGKVKQPYVFTYRLGEEPGLDKGLTNDAYLGGQFILDPNAMSKINEGAVTIPQVSPPSTGP